MNGILKEKTIGYPIAIGRELEDTQAIILLPDTQSTRADELLPGYSAGRGIENTSAGHHLLALFYNLRKLILTIEHPGTGRIDEQRLTARYPWLEAYHLRKDL